MRNENKAALVGWARQFAWDDTGVTAIEYALIAAATSLSLIATLPLIITNLDITYNEILGYFASV